MVGWRWQCDWRYVRSPSSPSSLVVDQGKEKILKRPSGSRLKAREGTGWVVLVLVMHLGAREIAIVVVLITDS